MVVAMEKAESSKPGDVPFVLFGTAFAVAAVVLLNRLLGQAKSSSAEGMFDERVICAMQPSELQK